MKKNAPTDGNGFLGVLLGPIFWHGNVDSWKNQRIGTFCQNLHYLVVEGGIVRFPGFIYTVEKRGETRYTVDGRCSKGHINKEYAVAVPDEIGKGTAFFKIGGIGKGSVQLSDNG